MSRLDPQDIESIAVRVVQLLKQSERDRVRSWEEDENQRGPSLCMDLESEDESGGSRYDSMALKAINHLLQKKKQAKPSSES